MEKNQNSVRVDNSVSIICNYTLNAHATLIHNNIGPQ